MSMNPFSQSTIRSEKVPLQEQPRQQAAAAVPQEPWPDALTPPLYSAAPEVSAERAFQTFDDGGGL
jgi:hypothetical protein